MMDSGTAILGMIVAQALRRNRKITMTTSATVSNNVNSISLTDARIVVVRSNVGVNVTDGGIEARSSGISALMRSTVSIMFAPGCRPIPITTAGFPFAYPEFLTSSIPSVTFAMSLSRTGAPLRYATIKGAYCSGFRSWSVSDRTHRFDESSRFPFGVFAFAERSADRTSSKLIP